MLSKIIKYGTALFLSCNAYAIQFDGFASGGIAYSDSENSYSQITKDLNLDQYSGAGLNAIHRINENWSGQMQILAYGFDDYIPNIEIASIIYEPDSNWTITMGRQRVPSWLISDYFRINNLFPWVQPPVEVYDLNPLISYNGIDIQYRFACSGLQCSIRVYGGAEDFDFDSSNSISFRGAAEELIGSSFSLSGENWNFRLAYARTFVDADLLGTATINGARSTAVVDFNTGLSEFYSLGFQWEAQDLFLYSEYARFVTEEDIYKDLWGSYLTLGYFFIENQLASHFTYAHSEHESSVFPGYQNSYELGINYYLNDFTVFKISGLRVNTWQGPGRFVASDINDISLGGLIDRVSYDAYIGRAIVAIIF